MLISKEIPLEVNDVIEAINGRQNLPWNNGRINDYSNFDILQKLFKYINSGVSRQEYFYQGKVFRIHSSHTTLESYVDRNRERIISKINDDGSCRVLPLTDYSDTVVAFSKNHDFTRKCFYKVYDRLQAVMFYCDTGKMFGIDINAFLKKYNAQNERFEEEQEILFPLQKEYVIKEYCCTPNQFNYYLRNI